MRPTVGLVDPVESAAYAAAVLRSAWRPPCLHYSDAYIRWQMAFPGVLPARLAIAFAGRDPVGCAGLTPRELQLNGARIAGYILSFVAVAPAWRGKGLAARLYETLLSGISPEVLTLAFAHPDSTGERVLVEAFANGFKHHALRACRAVGFASPAGPPANGRSSARQATESEFIAAQQIETKGRVLWNAPSPEMVGHYLRDPRPRSLLVMTDTQGRTAGTAMRVAAEMATASGSALQHVPMLENLRLTDAVPDVLRSAFSAAADLVPGATAIAPNVSHIDESVIKSARARSLPSVYNTHVFCDRDDLHADMTNVEVI